MSAKDAVSSGRRVPAWLWWVGAALVVALVVVLALHRWSSSTPTGSASNDPTASGSASPGASSSSSPASTADAGGPSASPTPEPTLPAAVVPATPGASAVPVPPLGDKPPVQGSGTDPLSPVQGVQVKLVALTPLTTSARGVGEIVGPGLAVTIEVSGAPAGGLDLSGATVGLNTGPESTPASPALSDPRNAPLPAALAAGKTARGTYIFLAPNETGTAVAIQVLLATHQPVLVFQASVA